MNYLNNYLICRICDKTYDDPIILPCYKTICSKHVFAETIGDTFKCNLCKSDHSITSNGFPKNKETATLVNLSKNCFLFEPALSENNQKAKELCDEFESIINKSELLAKDQKCYLYDYFSKIKSDLDLSREKYIKMIDDHYFKLLKIVEDAEKESQSNLNKINISKELSDSNGLFREKLVEFCNASGDICIINDQKWNKLQYEIEKNILIAEYQLKKFESKLLMSKSYEYKPNEALNDISTGELCVLENIFPNEERKKHTVRLTVDNLNTLQPNEIRIIKDLHILNNIPWVFSSTINQSEEISEFKFKIVINPEFRNQIKQITPNIYFKVLKNDGSISNDIVFEPSIITIEKTLSFSMPLKDFSASDYDIYNIEKNCAVFELDIEIKNYSS